MRFSLCIALLGFAAAVSNLEEVNEEPKVPSEESEDEGITGLVQMGEEEMMNEEMEDEPSPPAEDSDDGKGITGLDSGSGEESK